MTPVFLLENLQRFIEEKTADIILPVRIIFAVYSENGQDGPLALLNLMLRVRSELKKAGAVGGGQFVLEMPLEYIVYQDTTPPYYMGEMVTNWSLPVVQRDVAAVLQNL